jgi:hypothetical protein
MGLFQRQVPGHYIPIHQDNIGSKDWVILLEAGTIVGPSPERLRVARTMQERKIVKQKRSLFGGAENFLMIEGYDPRIHGVYFCPQLYKYDADKKLVPLSGDEIGRLIANALENGIKERRPWYAPAEQRPSEPVITGASQAEFDSLVVEMPAAQTPPRKAG